MRERSTEQGTEQRCTEPADLHVQRLRGQRNVPRMRCKASTPGQTHATREKDKRTGSECIPLWLILATATQPAALLLFPLMLLALAVHSCLLRLWLPLAGLGNTRIRC